MSLSQHDQSEQAAQSVAMQMDAAEQPATAFDVAEAQQEVSAEMTPALASAHLSEEERAIYDRQLRVWGVEAQKRSDCELQVMISSIHRTPGHSADFTEL
jgi:hypothetical protein